ncbi:MAG: tRNA (adenosine(37)-N6)-dimethylallyltransferase MiaA [Hyphomicrobiales bacterium]|nr:tRNA (adenosine(37)-N6)-dimethylallyltransferase MiaA [Hyphomicrobiales bacterium]
MALLIAGPTASGKSAIALALARRLDGVVINADSMQVYRDLRVLSARPSPGDEALAPHRLYGHVDGAVNYSVGQWLADARAALDAARASGQLAIVVGGTGLYFKALTRGLSPMPAVPEAVRETVRRAAEGVAAPELHARLRAVDPLMAARLRPSDPQRILRALEVFAASGRSLASFQAERSTPLLAPGTWRGLFLTPDRTALREIINQRFEAMMQDHATDEVAALKARGLDPLLPVMRAHGVPHLIAWLDGRLSREEAVTRAKDDTRAYARRQHTFARHQLPDFAPMTPQAALQAATTAADAAGFAAASA